MCMYERLVVPRCKVPLIWLNRFCSRFCTVWLRSSAILLNNGKTDARTISWLFFMTELKTGEPPVCSQVLLLLITWNRSPERALSDSELIYSLHCQRHWTSAEVKRPICRTDCNSFLSPSLSHNQLRSSTRTGWWNNRDGLENTSPPMAKPLCRRISRLLSIDGSFHAEKTSNFLCNSALSMMRVRRTPAISPVKYKQNAFRWFEMYCSLPVMTRLWPG